MFEDYSFVFDIDGTLCPIKRTDEKYEDLIPYPDMIDKLRYYKENGAKIILYTSRNMNSYNGNLGLINKYTAATLSEWLKKWDIPYDEIVYGKVWPGKKGFYVDDRTVRPDEFLNKSVDELEEICAKSRPCNKLDIVITMGGLGSRFREAGYTLPKYMIEAKGRTLFEYSMISLEGYRDMADRYIFLAMEDKDNDVEAFIRNKCAGLNIPDPKIIMLDHLTDGQATTALLSEKYWDPSHALLIYNIDTYVEPGCMNSAELKGDGFIPCFEAQGDHWSFVRLDDSGAVAEIKEKQRISSHCTLGAYYFRSCALYKELYEEYYSKEANRVNGEKYVAPLYDYLLSKGGKIYISDVDASKVHVLGTPKELEAFLKEDEA